MNREREIRQLCTFITPHLFSQKTENNTALEKGLVDYAIDRHGLGPLLYQATKKIDRDHLAEDAAQKLHATYRQNCITIMEQKAVERDLEKQLNKHNISWTLIKGTHLAKQLYANPSERGSRDIDILVENQDFKRALTALLDAGYIMLDTRSKKILNMRFFDAVTYAKLFKDITLVHPKFKVLVELHLRLFHLEPAGYTSKFYASLESGKPPRISNSHYLLYVILHGAMVHWPKLKMIVDLRLIIQQSESGQAHECLKLAESYDAAPAFLASIQLAKELFPAPLPDEWDNLTKPDRVTSHRQAVFQKHFHHALFNNNEHNLTRPPDLPKFWMLARDMFPEYISIPRTILQGIAGSIAVRL